MFRQTHRDATVPQFRHTGAPPAISKQRRKRVAGRNWADWHRNSVSHSIGSCSGLLKGMRQTATEIRGCRAAQASVPRGSEQGSCRSAGYSGRVAPRHAERNVVSLHVAPHCANVWRRWRAGCKSPWLNSGTITSKRCSYRLALECPCTCHFAASLY